MQFIASITALQALHSQPSSVSAEAAELGNINLGSSFYNTARVKQSSPAKKQGTQKYHRSGGLLVTLVLFGCLISGIEIFLLVNKLTAEKTTSSIQQVAKTSQTEAIIPATTN